MTYSESETALDSIAIIGLAGRFPGAENIAEFWQNLKNGVDSIAFFTDEELAEAGLDPAALRQDPGFVPAHGILKNPDYFDAAFFGINPRDAEVMDPQHRLFLETAWEALENAGCDPGQYRGQIGVFGGMSNNTYYLNNLHEQHELQKFSGPAISQGNEKDYLTTRVSYKLNLKGPSVNVNTACSTSLVAIVQACQSLLNFQTDVALAGGVSVTIPQKKGYSYAEGNIRSPDGRIRTFDAEAKGMVTGSGVGVVVLKRLADAIADRDCIHAVIRGAAVNNDGSERVSFAAPGVDGQAEVIAMAHALAQVDAETISYVEAHGTATPLGDPIEVAALTQAFRTSTQARGFCAIGSVKTNIGHLDVAAGVAGLIKTTLALSHKQLPASLNFKNPNPKLDLPNTPFYVNTSLVDWPSGVTPRRAGVSSFGIGGTNAHVVLEESPAVEPSGRSRSWQLLVLSAKTPAALDAATANLAEYLRQNPGVNLADVAFTLQTGRRPFNHRRIVVCRDVADAFEALTKLDAKRVFTSHQEHRDPPVAFLFPGQGAQHVNMGRELYETEPVFRAQVDQCCELLQSHLQLDLRSILYPSAAEEKLADEKLTQTHLTQPAMFVIEYALAQLWLSWGIKPQAMIGHSIGEYAAACLAEVFSRDDALVLLAARARLMQALPGGAMLAVRLPVAEVEPLLAENLSVAALNAPSLTVVSGPQAAIEDFEKQLGARKIAARQLATSHAFHSAMMDPMLEAYTTLVRQVRLQAPQRLWISSVTGKWITQEQATDPAYWARQLRSPVRFTDGVQTLMSETNRVTLEVGPGQTLTALTQQSTAKSTASVMLASLPVTDFTRDLASVLGALGRLWLAGVAVDWSAFYANERRQRVPLPTYPFERRRFWVEPVRRQVPTALEPRVETALPNDTQDASPLIPRLPASAGREQIIADIKLLLEELSGVTLAGAEAETTFLGMGFDSLFLTQASLALQNKFGVQISFRQLMEDMPSLGELAAYLEEKMPAPVLAAAPAMKVSAGHSLPASVHLPGHASLLEIRRPQSPSTGKNNGSGGSGSGNGNGHHASPSLGQILQNLHAIAGQLEALQSSDSSAFAPYSRRGTPPPEPVSDTPVRSLPEPTSHGPFRPIEKVTGSTLTAQQKASLDALIARYTKRTAESKRLTALHRPHLADPRSVAGFKPAWKELVYPIVVTRSEGSRLWDVDGNEYVDFIMGFGANFFGHSPAFITQAVTEQIQRGLPVGPQSPLAGEVARLVCELTGAERAAFCNTGSEAVMAALRIARTITNRTKVVVFSGDYHGIFDEVLVHAGGVHGELKSLPIAPGIPKSQVENIIVLEYGAAHSLEIIRSLGRELAAVLVEPVQSRRPELQPKEFLQELRTITTASATALIFDELVTGFRTHPGGAQAWFGVQADLATYGKVVGGGYPIGIVAGRAAFMDALDGGAWNYGDESFPQVGVTFFAGTFVRHPLVLAAAHAVLTRLREAGPELQQNLNDRMAAFVARINACISESRLPMRIAHFSSLASLRFNADVKFGNLFYYFLKERGIHLWENRAIILTTAHTDADLELFLKAFKESIVEMQRGDFLPGDEPGRVDENPAVKNDLSVAAGVRVPLTSAQMEIWLATQLGDRSSCAYNESIGLRFLGSLKPTALHQALQALVERHEALRTTFSIAGNYQQVLPALALKIDFDDLALLPESERTARAGEIFLQEGRRAFDLVNGPLFRARLIRFADQHHGLILTAHHLICDGWSFGTMIRELAELYSAAVKQCTPSLTAPMTFRTYVEQQAGQEKSRVAVAAESYWVGQFVDQIPVLELPSDRPRPAERSANGANQVYPLSPALYRNLKQFSAQQSCTLVVTLLAGFEILLHRLSGQDEVVVGIPAAGQPLTGVQPLVGHCTNLLPLRSRYDANQKFGDFLATTKRVVLDAYDHQHCSFGALLQKLNPRRSPGRVPLVSVIFNLDRLGRGVQFDGLETSTEPMPKSFTNFDLFLNVRDTNRELILDCAYNTDLFDAQTIQRWLAHFETLLEGMVSHVAQPLAKLPLLTAAGRQQLLVDWNDNAIDFPRDRCVHQLIEAQVARTPAATALIIGEQRFSYQELNARANQVAHHLRAAGVGPDSLVAVCMERSLEMVVGLLAVLKAGGAYVPLDPAYPQERLAFILEDARAAVLLTQERLVAGLPPHQARVVCLDTLDVSQENRENLRGNVRPENLAYVIFTSGSTGRPKGVAIEHRSTVAFTEWARTVFSPEEFAGVMFATSICFDLSVFELFVTLACGGKVILADNALQLPRLSAAAQVTLVNTVPSAIAELVRTGRLPDSVRTVNLAGEPLPAPLADKIYQNSAVQKVYDLYGPSEDTTYSTVALRTPGGRATIGRPIANTQVYLLDAQMQPVPIGVPGELFLGGEGLARGYWKRPELTAEKFVPDPFSSQPQARLYRTGDLARYLSDGNIEYLGRLDHQVKIRGFRIELGEIESVLQSAGVRQVLVIAQEHSGQKRLVAYVVNDPQRPVVVSELRAVVRAKLPEYMMPSAFVVLEKMPLTPNGKVDRKALPPPDGEPAGGTESFVAPRTPREQKVAKIWREVLDVKQVGIHDNFFDLGGHSLLAMQVISRFRDDYKWDLSLAEFFKTPTVAALAAGVIRAGDLSAAGEILPVDRSEKLPLSFIQQQLWFLHQLEPGSAAYHVPMAVRLNGPLNVDALRLALASIIERHEILRTTFPAVDGSPTQIIAPGAPVDVVQIDLRDLPAADREAQVSRLVVEASDRPFDVGQGPLLRFTLLQLSETEHLFILVMHHLVADGWSWGVLLGELGELYEAIADGKPVSLPALPVQYADFAHWQQSTFQGRTLSEQTDYWKEKLAGAPPALALPVDYPAGTAPAVQAAQCSVVLPAALVDSILALGRNEGSTLFMTMMSAVIIALEQWTRQADFVLGTVVAGRNHRELEKLIGCFINFLPLRVKFSADDTGLTMLNRVKAEVLDAMAHQDCPFEKIVEAVNPQRMLNGNPIYNVAFLLQNYPRNPLGTDLLSAVFVPQEARAALLDLRFVADRIDNRLSLSCEYRAALFEAKTIEAVLASVCRALEMLVREPHRRLADYERSPALAAQAAAVRRSGEKSHLNLVATFTAEPLEESLAFWLKKLELPATISFAPYNQVFQQLLDPASQLATNQRGLNVILLRLEDWLGAEPGARGFVASVEQNAREFIAAVKAAAGRNAAPLLLCLCPASKAGLADQEKADMFQRIEKLIGSELADLRHVTVMTKIRLLSLYPVADYDDPHGNELGHVPYTPEFFAALGTFISRKFHALNRPPHKVIVLDCDHTLWTGVVGEDGPDGVVLDAPRIALQNFMIEQRAAGRLLCLCSKNNAADVEEVFARRPEMPLRRDHITASCVNWQPKSDNLKKLAQELNLGLDSFIFVDDSPMECAEVQTNCPSVLTLQLPEPDLIPKFLQHCWAFDASGGLTAEDQLRAASYRQNQEREKFQAESGGMPEFIAGLKLRIEIAALQPEQIARVAQLTQRTNQFNCAPRPRTENDVKQLAVTGWETLAISVSDRFGDYGLVGVVVFQAVAGVLQVETLLLSCRVLGKGVEHAIIAHLGRLATERGLASVDVMFRVSPKNQPAHDFLETIGAAFKPANGSEQIYRFPAAFAAELRFHPRTEAVNGAPAKPKNHQNGDVKLIAHASSSLHRWIATEMNSPSAVLAAIEQKAKPRQGMPAGYLAPASELEGQLCTIWQQLLRVERVGVRDNFFELGGRSLLAVQLFARIAQLTGKSLPLVTIFQSPTIHELALIIQQGRSSDSLVMPLRAEGSRPPLFFAHGAGGGLLWGYANMSVHLGDDQPVYGIESRGIRGFEELTRIEDMAALYVQEMRRVQPVGPYYLAGYCFGGNVAYEMARQLHALGEKVAFVGLIDSSPPNSSYTRIPWWQPVFWARFVKNIYIWLSDFSDFTPPEKRDLVRRKLTVLRKRIVRLFQRRSAGAPVIDLEKFINTDLFPDHELKLWQVHMRANDAYVPRSYPGRVTLFRTRGQPIKCSLDPLHGWGELAEGGVDVQLVSGSHETVFMEPAVRTVSAQFKKCLVAAQSQIK